MIVRDESAVVGRALRTAIPYIDSWLIVDTGSHDDTPAVVRDALKGIPGALLRRKWNGFAGSRNEALLAARTMADYVVFLDADDFLTGDPQLMRASLEKSDLWLCWAYAGWVRHARTFAIHSDMPATWVGDRHESLTVKGGVHASMMSYPSVSMRYMHQGFRSKGASTFPADISVLEQARITSSKPSRSEAARAQFYIARSYHALGDFPNAIKHYMARARDFSGDEEERWYADFQACIIEDAFNAEAKQTLQRLASIALARPTRAEPLIKMASLLRKLGESARALELGECCASMNISSDRYFVDVGCHTWRAWTEIALTLPNSEHNDGMRTRYALQVLALPGVPNELRRAMQGVITVEHQQRHAPKLAG